jgi:hypothetical protein
MRLVIPAKAGIQHEIASAKGGYLLSCIWLKCYKKTRFQYTSESGFGGG